MCVSIYIYIYKIKAAGFILHFTKLSSSQISVAQFLHPRSAKTRGALLQLLSTKLNSQHLKLDIASFTLLNRAFQVTFFFFFLVGRGSTLEAAMAIWQYLSGSQVEPPEFPTG